MKILAIEASGPVAGCAVLEDGLLIADYNVQYKKKHAQSLVPMMDEVKQMLELDLQTVDAIAIAKGPGSLYGTPGSVLRPQKALPLPWTGRSSRFPQWIPSPIIFTAQTA